MTVGRRYSRFAFRRYSLDVIPARPNINFIKISF